MKKRTFISLILAALLAIASVFPVSAVALTDGNKKASTENGIDLKVADEARIQQILRSTYKCDYCYGNATATCNGERSKTIRNCGNNCKEVRYYSTAKVKCHDCSRSYTLSNSTHLCVEQHTTCGRGTLYVCLFR